MVSYNAVEPHPPRKTVLSSLRKREYQTRQQQVRSGTPRRIGCPPRLYDDDSAVVDAQQVVSPQGSPQIGTSGAIRNHSSNNNNSVLGFTNRSSRSSNSSHHNNNNSNRSIGRFSNSGKRASHSQGEVIGGTGKLIPLSASLPPRPSFPSCPSRKSSSPSLSTYSSSSSSSSTSSTSFQQPQAAIHPLASSLTRDDDDSLSIEDQDDLETMDTTQDSTPDTAMDWSAVSLSSPSSPPSSRRMSTSSSSSTDPHSFMMVTQPTGFGHHGGSATSSTFTPSVYSLGSSSSASSSTTDLNSTLSRRQWALTNAHLSSAQLASAGVGRRMSSPTISTSYNNSSPFARTSSPSSGTSCRRTTADVMQPRPSSALSGARTWVSSSASTPTVSSISNERFSTGNQQQQQLSPRRRRPSVSLSQTGSNKRSARDKSEEEIKVDGTTDIVSSRMPLIVAEREYAVDGYDKIFAAKWISSDEILMGTKCNKLFILNTRTDRRISLGRLDESIVERPEEVHARISALHSEYEARLQTPVVVTPKFTPKTSNASSTSSGTSSTGSSMSNFSMLSGSSTIGLASSLERGLRFFNAGRRSSTPSFSSSTLTSFPQAATVASVTNTQHNNSYQQNSHTTPNNNTNNHTQVNLNNTNNNQQQVNGTNTTGGTEHPPGVSHTIAATSTSAGIRSISINPSKTLMAVGSGEPFQVTIYSVPEYEPVGMMYGHTDLVFALTWISDTVLVSGSRDGSIRVWSMGSEVMSILPAISTPVNVRFSVLKKVQEKARIRDLALNRGTGQIMTLAAEGYVKLWDRENYNQIFSLKMIHPAETVCLTANSDANLYAVGSQSHISIVDPRSTGVVHVADSCDEGWGVRALDFKSHIITTGGGYGRIGFYDMRAQRYLDGFENGTTKRQYLDIGHGWLNRDTAYAGTISGITIRNAVYALEYDASGSRLFTAGGPLQLGLCGAYAGLWS